MELRYSPAEIEAKWQAYWAKNGVDKTPDADDGAKKFYALSMFPYPSGDLHMGHVRNYTITDVIARVRRMQGYRVLHPMGWDAFGLPAENAAIKRGVPPAEWTLKNIAQMREQLKSLGLSYDWDREVATCLPNYYHWTQWIFLQFFDAGLAYQKEAAVNWDPIDQTVLANEQVDSEGRSWRSGAKVERKLLRQWFFKITAYAEQLLTDLDKLPGWPERVKTMQANWIGKSTGAQVTFKTESDDELVIYTTRPDTLWGATFMVLSPEHPLMEKLTTKPQSKAVEAYQEAAANLSTIDRTAEGREKTGVWTGSYAINPVNGEKIPIWTADYVMMDYGTGAIMAVPAHDQRDFAFARKFELPIKAVIQPEGESLGAEAMDVAYAGAGVMVHSGPLDGVMAGKGEGESVEGAIAYLEKNNLGQGTTNYRLRDWLVSRQRYWGAPIPIIHCSHCGTVPVPTADLPVKLPDDVEFTGKGASPLSKMADWVNVPCPNCQADAKRETDTMDTFLDSSWYFLRYADANNPEAAFTPDRVNDWLPVDQYVGGIEHAILHLLYSRFFTKVLRDRGFLNFDEPFQRLLTQGMVQAITYKNTEGQFFVPADIADLDSPTDPETGDALQVSYEKMSKSKFNGVPPAEVLAKYGADTARMFILFKSPPEKDLEWDDADVEGQYRFLNRVWRAVMEFAQSDGVSALKAIDGIQQSDLSKADKALRRATHTAIKEITEDIEGDYQFNTAVSELMKLSNAINEAADKTSPAFAESICTLVRLIAPFAPHIAEELWSYLGSDPGEGSVHQQPWPQLDPAALVADEITLVIQIMGKTRGTLQVPAGADKAALETYARESEIAQRYLAGKEIKKVIVVPGKLVNFVAV
ncbi:leucine--tRNA ligase [Leptolyngbya sp. BC1307]|uniref:leucine--tRNA ligase n=1 Tax=Leptolyngbya sp. BC1307 TaxID=2029589 RepID=UPI000EFA97FA|nr:leucine--tRNA ligase [Leptolyngbya sp. BC1307]